jgi:hypothetical protein
LKLSCLCGQASVEVARLPDFVFECNCTLCTKSGARWGYFAPGEVTPSGETRAFRRADKADPASQIHFCPNCGVTTHFTLTESAIARFGNSMAGVNMALADESDLSGIELRFPNGKSWTGEGEFTFLREPRVLGRG